MQRLCAKLRSLTLQSTKSYLSFPSSHRLLHSSTSRLHQKPLHFPAWSMNRTVFNPSSQVTDLGPSRSSPFPLSLVQVRHVVSRRDRRSKRRPMSPVTSKVKKVKIKAYSSYKSRFRTLSDGTIRRWREGKNHNAHLKSRKARRRLRKPSIVPVAYAKVMKKLNFCG